MASNPTQEKIDGLLSLPADQPIVLMNLLRFSEGGDKTFQEYVRHCQKHGPRFGVEFVYLGKSSYVVVAEEGQAWDAVWLVRYPNPKAFFETVQKDVCTRARHCPRSRLAGRRVRPRRLRGDAH